MRRTRTASSSWRRSPRQRTTVVTAEVDVPCFHEMSDVLAHRIANARKVTVPGVGQMVNMEAPEVVNALLRRVCSIARSRDANPAGPSGTRFGVSTSIQRFGTRHPLSAEWAIHLSQVAVSSFARKAARCDDRRGRVPPAPLSTRWAPCRPRGLAARLEGFARHTRARSVT
jgi:hypothetical protein